MYICLCKGITDSDVRNLGCAGVVSPGALAKELGIDRDDCCGRCVAGIAKIATLAKVEHIKTTRMAPTGTTGRHG
jgi:bacterioferritin-associated ferredoxin